VKALWTFLTEMDARTARALWVSVGLFVAATFVLVVGSAYVEVDQGAVTELLHALRASWWSPAVVTGVFTVLAFIGAPQIMLIAATVAVFGSGLGIVLSWIATMISAAVGFYMGRYGGQGAINRLGGDFLMRMRAMVTKNGFLAAGIIRLVPSGPFIMVNMALGALGVRPAWYFGGTGLGIIPKIIVVALAGHGMDELFSGDNLWALGFLAAAAAGWLVIVFIVRPRLRKQAEPNGSD
jgi:uncharacterized membrane protein YdjX (TVP38/TMEM64 family)